ncbi:hypothetical protein FLLO111716_05805 [Flavobacterium longum]
MDRLGGGHDVAVGRGRRYRAGARLGVGGRLVEAHRKGSVAPGDLRDGRRKVEKAREAVVVVVADMDVRGRQSHRAVEDRDGEAVLVGAVRSGARLRKDVHRHRGRDHVARGIGRARTARTAIIRTRVQERQYITVARNHVRRGVGDWSDVHRNKEVAAGAAVRRGARLVHDHDGLRRGDHRTRRDHRAGGRARVVGLCR